MKSIFRRIRLKRYVLYVLTVCIIAAGTGLSGCSGANQESYNVYYVNKSRTAIVPVKVSIESEDGALDRMRTLIDEMNNPRNGRENNPAKPESVIIDNMALDGDCAYIYFTDSYNSMDSASEVLYRAALVKTVTQIEEIKYVAFYVAGAPAAYADGSLIGIMAEDDFIDSADGKAKDIKWCDLKLYFANAKGDKLLPASVSVAYNKNVPIERVIVEQLIAGPGTSEYYRTLPDNLKLLGISITEDVCYVNLDSSFLNGLVNAVDMVPVYSIVNSLCELDTVNYVQILVNGESNKMYRESISLERRFSANKDIVQTSTAQQATQQPTQTLIQKQSR